MRIDRIGNWIRWTLCGGLALAGPAGVLAGPPHATPGAEGSARLVARQEPESEVMTQQPEQLPGRAVPGTDVLIGEAPYGVELTPEEVEEIERNLIGNILEIEQPGQRALALVRAARFQILEQNFSAARQALESARAAALEEPDPRIRDLRIMAVVDMLVQLAETQISEAVADPLLVSRLDQLPPIPGQQRFMDMRQANEAFQQAAELAARILQPAYQSEKLFHVVEQQANGGQTVALEVLVRGPAARSDLEELFPEIRQLVDQMFVVAAAQSWNIQRPAWRDQALLAVASAAAISRTTARGVEIAGSIPSPVVRSEAFIRIAESEARRGTPEMTTLAYSEAARAIAAVPIDDLRATLTNVLIDSLVSSGRFQDARACIPLYPDESRRLAALGAIAESQGRRGLSEEARQWIAREVRPEHHALLYRRVNDGVLHSLERYRADRLMRQ